MFVCEFNKTLNVKDFGYTYMAIRVRKENLQMTAQNILNLFRIFLKVKKQQQQQNKLGQPKKKKFLNGKVKVFLYKCKASENE